MAELDFSDIRPDETLTFDDIKPRSLMDEAHDAGKGFFRGAKKRKIGTMQAVDDVRRWVSGDMGTEYSPFRTGINDEYSRLKLEGKQAPLSEKVGEGLYDVAEGAAIPLKGSNFAQKFLWNAGTGAGLGLTMPSESGNERIDNAILGTGTSSIGMPVAAGAGKGALKVGRIIGSAASDALAKKDAVRAAAEEITNELGKGRNINLATGGNSGGRGTGGGSADGGSNGDRWGQLEGFNPTAGMLYQTPEILQLEKNARTRNGTPFLERDIANQASIWDTLRRRVYGNGERPQAGYEGVRSYLNNLANTITTPMREDAMETARRGLLEDVPLFVRNKAEGLLSDVRTRSDPNAKKIGKETLGLLDDLDAQGLAVDPWDVYNIKKLYADRLKASGGQAMDDMTNATKAGRVHAKSIMDAVDDGINTPAMGKWREYNQTHSNLMRPIDEFSAMGKVLDSFENAPTLPNMPSTPLVTRAKLDTAVDNNTWRHGSDGFQDLLSPESRGLLSEAQDATQAIEHAKGGNATTAISGSQTTPLAMQAMKNGLKKVGTNMNLGWAIDLADALGTSQGQRALDEALLDPSKLQAIVEAYNKGLIGIEHAPMIQAIKRSLRNVPSLLDN